MADRKFITDSLRKAAFGYLLKLGYSCYGELGIEAWGRHRADVLATNLKSEIVMVEIKSSVADYTSDHKWETYLDKCNRFFFCFTEDVWLKLKPKIRDKLLEHGAGVLVLCPKEGLLRVKLPCERRPMKGALKKLILTRMAWRGGEASKRNSRRNRVFLSEDEYNDFKENKAKKANSPKRRRTRRPSRRNRRRRS